MAVQAYIVGVHDLPDDCPFALGDGTAGTIAVKEGRKWDLYSVERFNELFEWA